MEKDNEVAGVGNSYNTFYRQYDPRLGRWKSMDPVQHPWQSSYAAFDNNPVYYTDPLGAMAGGGDGDEEEGTPTVELDEFEVVYERPEKQVDPKPKTPDKKDGGF